MEWVWIRSQLRVAEWHLDLAVSSASEQIVGAHLQRAQEAYALAMTALEHEGLNTEEQSELKQRMQELSVRLHSIEHRSR